ncbi:NUDIX domain-containing protein [Rhodocytophaga rosea]|uniref:NUDIX domain-containing protein n=1 Tax=Rhodocytophaga rosea TaxID=2704465 RepID=A0A6C0GMC7_9BACT|nr:NUDIX domain-containing protein [Rhodocytophaga rosea]QHT69196.1 NUDIX domain-containing protein [Rhodocytophaga rosea]
MNLFVNDKPVRFVSTTHYQTARYDVKLDGQNTQVKASQLQGNVVVIEPSVLLLYKLFTLMRVKKLKKLISLTFITPSKADMIKVVKSQFKIVKAAGGLVSKGDQILLMYRLKKWDLPKGKLDKDEKPKAGAIREVEEECNIRVKVEKKICSTWHTYTQNGNKILKKTKWYAMTSLDDSQMKPQAEEDIEQLIWVDRTQAKVLLSNSYESVRYVFEQYYKKQKALQGE